MLQRRGNLHPFLGLTAANPPPDALHRFASHPPITECMERTAASVTPERHEFRLEFLVAVINSQPRASQATVYSLLRRRRKAPSHRWHATALAPGTIARICIMSHDVDLLRRATAAAESDQVRAGRLDESPYMYTPLARISHLIASELQVHVASESVTSNIVILIVWYQ